MKHLKSFNESTSIFNPEWVKMIPKELTIITNNGTFTLKRTNEIESTIKYPVDTYNTLTDISFLYTQNTVDSKDGDVTADGEPDMMQFDIAIVKDNDGTKSNPDSLRLNIDITYGDHMQYEFTIDKPNKVKVYHYTGKNSLYDPETFWGFKYESLSKLIEFFNRFGFNTTMDDFKFLDENPDSYSYERPIEKGDKLEPMIMDEEEKSEVDALKGGDKIKKYDEFKTPKEL